MEFLVHVELDLPSTLTVAQRDELAAAESARAAELRADGRLRRLWRIPGRRANWGLWEAADATELHEALASLPLWPWMDVEVVALAEHPNDDPGGQANSGRQRRQEEA